jgi:carboxypeptidase C (cathepsin A)
MFTKHSLSALREDPYINTTFSSYLSPGPNFHRHANMRVLSTLISLASILNAGLVLSSPHREDKSRGNKPRLGRNDYSYLPTPDHVLVNSTITYKANSGICETTPGVAQYSGYISIEPEVNLFFWLFEARTNPTTAPLAMWLNGGPGCSSMVGLFAENGPCHFVDGSSDPVINPYSWNTVANVLYVDQPVGVGFSYGEKSVNSTIDAAVYMWRFLQAFYDEFDEFTGRDFGIFTESYGGHFAPALAIEILSKNVDIEDGDIQGNVINLVALGINNGWIDPKAHYKSYVDFSANNTYRKTILEKEYTSYMRKYDEICVPALEACQLNGAEEACINAIEVCAVEVGDPLLEKAGFDAAYDMRIEGSTMEHPEEPFEAYLKRPEVAEAIGARRLFDKCPADVHGQFLATGDCK